MNLQIDTQMKANKTYEGYNGITWTMRRYGMIGMIIEGMFCEQWS